MLNWSGEKWLNPRALAWVVSVVFAVLIANEVVSVIVANTAVFTGDDNSASKNKNHSSSFSSSQPVQRSLAQGIKQVTQAYLFGQTKTVHAKEVVEEAPDTKLQLGLKGIFANSDGSSFAIISYKTKPQQHFSLGESVYGLAKLHEIYKDRIILQRKANYETLRLPVDDKLIAVKRGNKLGANKEAVPKVKRPLLNEFDYYVKLLPEYDEELDDDSLIGFEILSATAKGKNWLDRLGLEIGDIIVSANGVQLKTEDSIDVFDAMLDTEKSISVVIKRNNSLSSFTLK